MCGKPANVVDHIIPHKGNALLRDDRSNWQPLCAPCHNSTKQSQERRS
ncbi:HNH endonuclease signature motif containing protein [Bosea sp. RCC_152_1]